jgi:hypothetical protein
VGGLVSGQGVVGLADDAHGDLLGHDLLRHGDCHRSGADAASGLARAYCSRQRCDSART